MPDPLLKCAGPNRSALPPNASAQAGGALATRVWQASAVFLIAAVWLAARPYHGILHDGLLYTAQALRRLQPDPLGQDLAFAFGSQDSFSLFSVIYAPLLDRLGVARGHLVMTLAGQLVWLAALLLLLRRMFGPGHAALMAAAAVAALEPHYGPWRLFAYGESFATARLWAEACVLAALPLAMPGRDRALHPGMAVSALLFVVGALLHPLVTLPGIAIIGIFWALRYPLLWALAVIGVAGTMAAALAGIAPFDRLLQRYDPEWLAIVRARTGYAFLGRWAGVDWIGAVLQGGVLAAAFSLARADERRLVAAILTVVGLALGMAFLGGDVAANVLMVNLQSWRALWILAVAANACAAIIVLRLPTASLAREVLILALACQVAERFGQFSNFFSPVLMVLALLLFWRERRYGVEVAAMLRTLVRIVELGVCALVAAGLWFAFEGRSSLPFAGRSWLAAGAAALALGLIVFRGGAGLRRVAGLAAAALLAAVAGWAHDRRSGTALWREAEQDAAGLTAFIGTDTAPYWEQGLPMLWLKLRRPAFYGCTQGAGIMFFRGMALEYRRRSDVLSALDTADFERRDDQVCPGRQDPSRNGPVSVDELAAVCRALPELEVLILGTHVAGAEVTTWESPRPLSLTHPSPLSSGGVTTFYRYACASLR